MNFKRLFFGIFYRIGFTPWDGHRLPARLKEIVDRTPRGKALDLGCGTGDTTIFLTQHGWDVVGVDFVERAIDRARAKAAKAGISARFMQADVTKLASFGVGQGFQLLVDSGCLHGISDEERDAYLREVTALAAPSATLVLSAFRPGQQPGVRGMERAEVERRFSGAWELVRESEDPASNGKAPLYIYELRKKAAS